MGRFERILCVDELDQIPKMRRSIVSKIDLNPGDVISIENVELKRPGTGIPPTEFYEIIGRKVNKTLEQGSIILPSDLI
jgi:N-acetylneuraminate synthase